MRKIIWAFKSVSFLGYLLGASLFLVCIVFAAQIVRLAPLTYSVKSTNTTVNGTATALPTTSLAGRESIALYNSNASTTTVFIGASDVTANNGFPLTSSAPALTIDVDDSVVVYGIVSSGTADIRTLEAK